ncbi:hypothetical protein BX661DRAFT_199367 [Kickxella alabastrina]|uniref:uncharacterized protein n=1 Tax=Kickxella alabastrina TaxID=61397 RepID=UPI00221F7BE7|nr:uncharacterized protein BX661DRAFT_199367 [Kickxella alabastrina]KAI7825542.1 hypothetical protein BX661DRAFT_199367 [Kickxella alabastrina]
MLVLVGSGRALGTVWWVRPHTQLTVGRRDTALVIDGDHSVSRRHATVTVISASSESVEITDAGSKFGVRINDTVMERSSSCMAHPGDRIEFGAQGSVFIVRQCDAAMCVTKMRADAASQTSEQAQALGFRLVDDIAEASFVMMPAVAATRTLLRALALGCHIADPGFLNDAADVGPAFHLPDATPNTIEQFVAGLRFLPEPTAPPQAADSPVELDARTLRPDAARRCLFFGHTFIFADGEQLKRMQVMVADAGGRSCALPVSDSCSGDQVRAMADGRAKVCLVLPLEPGAAADKIRDAARAACLRPVSESEISLALLVVSTDEHTNPALVGTADAEADAKVGTGSKVEAENNIEIAAALPARSTRRRAAPRISNFWSAMVASDNSGPEPMVRAEDGKLSPPPAAMQQTLEPEHGDELGPVPESDPEDHEDHAANQGTRDVAPKVTVSLQL